MVVVDVVTERERDRQDTDNNENKHFNAENDKHFVLERLCRLIASRDFGWNVLWASA